MVEYMPNKIKIGATKYGDEIKYKKMEDSRNPAFNPCILQLSPSSFQEYPKFLFHEV